MIEPRFAALLLIDMQHGFIDKDSPLCIEGAYATIPACAKALAHARSTGVEVIHVIRSYAEDGSDVEATRYDAWAAGGKPISTACANPRSFEEPDAIAPQSGDRVIIKPRFSAFFATELDLVLRRLGINTVVLAGTTTPNCIRTTCYDALSLDYNVVVLENCTSSRSSAVQAANIEDMRAIGAHIMSGEEFCNSSLETVPNIQTEVANKVQAARLSL